MSRLQTFAIGLFLVAAICAAPRSVRAFEVYKAQATPRSDGVMFGTYPRAGSVGPVTVLQDVGMFPMQRVSWDRWSWIETSPGVYEWNEAEFGILVDSHKFGAESVGSVYMADKIPSFYPQDINDPATRAAAADFIRAYYLEMEQRLGYVWVVIDYEMQWYDFAVAGIDPDDWADWYVFLVNEVKSVIPDATVICDVIADGHGYYLPGEWLTTAMSVSDALGIDDYGATPQIIHDDIQWLIDNYADGKPIYILENGFSTWTGLSNKAHGTEEEQAQYFEDVIGDVMTSFRPQVKSYLQFMYPDMGTGDNIEYHWGLVTQNNGREKPALDVFRAAYADYPPYDVSLVRDIKDDLDAGSPETFVWTSGTEFEFLQLQQVLDVTTVANATLSVDFTNDDGTSNFIVEANGTWKYASSGAVNVSDYLVHGVNVFNLYFPQKSWPGGATVRSVNLVLDENTDPIKESFEVYIDDMDLSSSWEPYFNVLPWLYSNGSPLAYDGEKSMALSYLCSIAPYFGTVTREFSPAEDWSSFDGFGFYVKGQPSNKDEKIRATLEDASGGLILAWQFFGVNSNTHWTPCEVHFSDVLGEDEMWKLAGVKKLEIAIIGQSRSTGTFYVDDLFCLSRADTFPPLLLSAEPLNPTSVQVRFTEPVTIESVEDLDNYLITDDNEVEFPILSVVGVGDNRTAMLTTSPQEAKPYKLHVQGIEDANGNVMRPGVADTMTFRGNDTPMTGVGSEPGRGIWLSAAPNPFRRNLSVSFGADEGALSGAVPVTIRVFDVAGRLVRTLAHNASAAGPTRYVWDGRSDGGRALAAGVYFLRLQAGSAVVTKQVVLTR
jgi:hypothetical protein